MEPSYVDVEALLRSLQSGLLPYRLSAIRSLAQLPTSGEQIVRALLVARETDAHPQVRSAAAEALYSPVHQAYMQAYPDWVNATVAWAQQTAQQQARMPAVPLGWWETWRTAIFKPSVPTFERISADPDASVGRAALRIWVTSFFALLIVNLIVLWLVLADYGATDQVFRVLCSGEFLVAVLKLGLIALGVVVGFLINAAVTHLVARALRGEGTYSQLAYTNASFWAPLLVVTWTISLISGIAMLNSGDVPSWFGWVLLVVSVLQLVFGVIAAKAVYRFSWVKAIATVVLAYIILVGLVILLAWALSGGEFDLGRFFEGMLELLGL